MKASALNIVGAILLLGACSSSSGPPEGTPGGESSQVAGGQSGTDGAGSYSCDLDPHTEAGIPLDQPIESPAGCTAEEATARLSRAGRFDCGALGEFDLSVGAATAARKLTGVMYSDTGDPGPGVPCYSLAVDAPIHIASTASNVSVNSPGFVVGHLCTDFEIETYASDDSSRQRRFFLFVSESSAGLTVWVEGQGAVPCSQIPAQ